MEKKPAMAPAGLVTNYQVTAKHPIFDMPTLGAFRTCEEAGQVVDRLAECYPGLEAMVRNFQWPEQDVPPAEWYAAAHDLVDMLCAPAPQLSVIEPIRPVEADVFTWEMVLEEARLAGCAPEDIVVATAASEGERGVWVVSRLHLSTTDRRKAESAARWLRRGRDQAGIDHAVTVVVGEVFRKVAGPQ
ncbi:hypothetical protein [Pseudomonas sp. AN-1]|uniref:hypothetical protein n=1 Tax=Pseudomonas sp. AN-1 TaxID=3096605 RepID=UPI002A6B4EB5|nr:hypothetical protein [Pseudomonas sp. AN-1]WPP46616.1 hypothetical protein SK095_04285 [Pseudomonas sp. AN-1]